MEEAPPTIRNDRLNEEGPDSLLILVLAFLVPGAGHAVRGRLGKGIGFFLVVGFMFTTGVLLEGRLYGFDSARPLASLATVVSHGSGMFDLAARFAGWTGNGLARTYEYGSAFILTAGLMNLLLVLDVWEDLSEDDDPSEVSCDDDEGARE